MIQKESIDIPIKPGTKKIGESITVEKLVQKYGSGNYLLLFIIKNYVIAKKSFVIEEKTLITAKIPNEQIKRELMQTKPEKTMQVIPESPTIDKNSLTTAKKEAKEDILKEKLIPKRQERNIPTSPSEMMK
jgi:hypothetical protein